MKGLLKDIIVAILIIVSILVVTMGICYVIACVNQETITPDIFSTKREGQQYALTGKVVSVDIEQDCVTVEDYNGNLWEFSGVEDWEIEDGVSILMNDMGTSSVYDDEIEGVRYTAWTLTR